MREDDVRRERGQFRGVSANVIGIDPCPTKFDPHAAAIGPAQLRQLLDQRGDAGDCFRVGRGRGVQHADPPYRAGLLRARRDRPRSRAAEQRDELAAFQLIELHLVPHDPGAHNRISANRPR